MAKKKEIVILVCEDEDGKKTNLLAIDDFCQTRTRKFENKVRKILEAHFEIANNPFDEYLPKECWDETVKEVASGLYTDWLGNELYYETIELF